jgi:hypothetical protein
LRVTSRGLGDVYKRQTMLGLFSKLGGFIRDGVLDTPAGPIFDLVDYQKALSAAASDSKEGKVYLKINPS